MGLFAPIWMTDNLKKKDKATAEVRKTTDQEMLLRIAKEAPLEAVGITAVKKLNDDQRLAQIANEAPHEAVRVNAVKKINDEPLLAQFAINPPPEGMYTFYSVPQTAIEKISDEKLLCKIAISAAWDGARKEAVKKITDPDLLEMITKYGSGHSAADAAHKITDMARIERILMTCNDQTISSESLTSFINRIEDNELMKKLARNAFSSKVRSAAASRAIDTDILLDKFLSEDNFWERSEMVHYLCESIETDPLTEEQRQKLIRALIEEVAENVKLEYIWKDAVDIPALREISKHANKPEYRSRALEELLRDEDAVKENEIKPIYLETIYDPKSHFNPDLPNRYKWQESINGIVWRISKKPELLLDFVQDADMDCVMAACCVKELFLLNSDKCENIADIQDKAVSSYLEHIPLFLQKTKVSGRNEGFYLRELGRVLPSDRRKEYGFDVFYDDLSGITFKGRSYGF